MLEARCKTLTIKTPEGIEFSLLLAGPLIRFLAWILDALCIQVILWALGTVLGLFRLLSADLASGLFILGQFVVGIGYGISLEWLWRGQTLGKRLLRLRVVDEQGLQLQLSQVVIRNLLRFVDKLPLFYLLGGVSCLLSEKAQRLGDLAASTLVIRMPKTQEVDLEQISTGKYNSFKDYPHLTARLRQRVSPEEADVALRAVLRREELDPEARVELFRHLEEYLKSVVTFPETATDGLSPEQHVRNAVEILYGA